MRKKFIVLTKLPRRALSRFNIGMTKSKTTKGENRHMADWQSLDPEAAREAEKYDNPIPSRELILAHLAERGAPASISPAKAIPATAALKLWPSFWAAKHWCWGPWRL